MCETHERFFICQPQKEPGMSVCLARLFKCTENTNNTVIKIQRNMTALEKLVVENQEINALSKNSKERFQTDFSTVLCYARSMLRLTFALLTEMRYNNDRIMTLAKEGDTWQSPL